MSQNYYNELRKLLGEVPNTPTENNNIITKQPTVTQKEGINIYDADTVYKDGQGYRLSGIDAPEMPSQNLKLDRLNKARESKLQRHVSLATPGEATLMESYIGTTDKDTSITKGLGDKAVSFNDTQVAPEVVDYGSEKLSTTKKDLFGRTLIDNPEYEKKMIGEGYVVPFNNSNEEYQDRLFNAVYEKEGLWESNPAEMEKLAQKRGVSVQKERVDLDGMVGETADITQSSLVQQYGKANKALRKGSRWLADKLGVEQETIDTWLPKTEDVGTIGFGEKSSNALAEREAADKLTGVMVKTREEQDAAMKKATEDVEKGEYLNAAMEVFTTLPYILGDSTGEIATLMMPGVGVPLAIGTRVSEQAEEYKKNNGKEPDSEWLLDSTLTNAAALLGEKFILKAGAKLATKPVNKVAGVVGATGAEAAQEWFDETQQRYMTQKEGDKTLYEVATSPETQVAAMAGGLAGGTLAGTGAGIGVITDRVSTNREQENREEPTAEKPTAATSPEKIEVEKGYNEAVSNALKAGDIKSAVDALKVYASDIQSGEGQFNPENYEKLKAAVRESIVTKTAAASEDSKQAKELVGTYGSTPEAVSSVLYESNEADLGKLKEAIKNVEGSDKLVAAVDDALQVRKSMAQVSEELKKDVEGSVRDIVEGNAEVGRANLERLAEDRRANLEQAESAVSGWKEIVVGDLEARGKEATIDNLIKLKEEYKSRKQVDNRVPSVTVGTTEMDARYVDVIQDMIYDKLGKENDDKGFNQLLKQKRSEVEAINRLVEKYSRPEVVELTEEVKSFADRAVEKAGNVEKAKEFISSRANGKDVSKVLDYIASRNPVEAVADKIINGEELGVEDIQVQANDGQKLEEVLKERLDGTDNKIEQLIGMSEKESTRGKAVSRNEKLVSTGKDISGLDGIENEVIQNMRSEVGKYLKEVANRYNSKNLAEKVEEESPARMLMNEKQEFPQSVVDGMVMTILGYADSRLGELRSNDDRQILKMLGMKDGLVVPPEVSKMMRGVGRFYSLEAATIGKMLRNELGVVQSNEAEYGLQDRLDSDLGAHTIAVMEKMGLVKYDREGLKTSVRNYAKTAIENWNFGAMTKGDVLMEDVMEEDGATATIKLNFEGCK